MDPDAARMIDPLTLFRARSGGEFEVLTLEGQPWAYRDPAGTLTIQLPGAQPLRVVRSPMPDAVLGPADDIVGSDGFVMARVMRTDWGNPKSIPAIDRPGALPRGAGSLLLNALATAAAAHQRPALRYRGPYPTSALFRSLRAAFRTRSSEEEFTQGVEGSAATGQIREVPVDFQPAPFALRLTAPRVIAGVRQAVERVFIDGQTYAARDPFRQLRATSDGVEAVLAFGPVVYASRIRLSPDGSATGELGDPPACTSDLVGAPIPRPLLQVVAQASISAAPQMLRRALALTFERCPFHWGDPGEAPAIFDGSSIVVHAALGEVLPGLPPGDGLGLLLAATDPVARAIATRALARAVG